MPAGHLGTKPRRKTLYRIVGKGGLGDFSKKPRVKHAGLFECVSGPLTFTFQHRKIETNRMPDDNRAADKLS